MPIPTPLTAPPIPETDLLTLILDAPGTKFPPDRVIFQSDADSSNLTFTELRRSVRAFGAGLHALGVKQDDCVMILALHGLHYPVALLGTMCAGATCVPVNPGLLVPDVVKYIDATNAKIIVVGPQFLPMAEELKKRYKDLQIVEISSTGKHVAWERMFEHGEIDWPRDEAARQRTAVIAFSSGTSGLPKGCIITQANIVANEWIMHHATLTPGQARHDINLGAFPPFHVAGIWGSMIHPLYRGTTQILMSAFTFPAFLGLIAKYKPTDISAAPPIILGLAVGPGIEKVDFSSVRRIGVGAAPLSAELAEKCLARLRKCGGTQIKLRQVWGMSETVCCASTFVDDTSKPYDEKAEAVMSGSVGFPLPGMTLKLVDVVTDNEITTPGDRGEILVKGPCVFKGYLPSTLPANAKRTDYFTEDGFYRTGDVGITDAEGRLRIVDRIKELIKVSGFQVAPAELEGILLESELISDCAVIGVPPGPGASNDVIRKGEMVMAFIVPAATTGKNAMHPERLRKTIHAWFNPQVVGYKRLTGGIRVVDAVPKVSLATPQLTFSLRPAKCSVDYCAIRSHLNENNSKLGCNHIKTTIINRTMSTIMSTTMQHVPPQSSFFLRKVPISFSPFFSLVLDASTACSNSCSISD